MTSQTTHDVDKETLAHYLAVAKTESDIRDITEQARRIYGETKWHPVGDRPNNIGTIRLGSDPALGIIERIINAQDSLLDLAHHRHPDTHVQSPIEAAHLWYNIPTGGLAEMSARQRRMLGERIRVWLEDSGVTRRPTIVWEDDGIGQVPEDFPKTFTSLNESNKVGQKWNMGVYGQGGAVTFGFCKATLIYSRRHPQFRKGYGSDAVGWTIVKEFDTDPEKNILPTYRYLVGPDGSTLQLPASLFELAHGSRITAVAYDLQGLSGPFTTQLWQFLNGAIFEPVLPFLLSSNRRRDRQYGSRIITGNKARLDRPDRARGNIDIAHHDSTNLDLGDEYGRVVFDYWVVRRPAGSSASASATSGYVSASTAVSMTLFGQRQDVESRLWIRNTAKLPFLFKNLVIQINANSLTATAKRELFASTRERATKSELRTRIYRHLGTVLRHDEELKRLNHEEKERRLRQSTTASSEKVKKRLAKHIKTRLMDRSRRGKGSTHLGFGGTRRSRGGTSTRRRITDDRDLGNFPSELRIDRKEMVLRQGTTCWTWVHLDAKNGYLPEQDGFLTVELRPSSNKVRLATRSRLLGGKSRWIFEADPDAPLGDVGVSVTLITPQGMLSSSTVLHVKAALAGAQERTGTEPEIDLDVKWVHKEAWDEHDGMDRRTVGYVTQDDTTIIWVNRNFYLLDQALVSRGLTYEQISTRSERYQFPVAAALWLQEESIQDNSTKKRPIPSDQYRKLEMERLAEAVLLASDPDVELAYETSSE